MAQVDELFALLDTSKTGRVSSIVWQSVSSLMEKHFADVDKSSLFPRVGKEFPLTRQRYDTFMARLFKFNCQKASKAMLQALTVAKFTSNPQHSSEKVFDPSPSAGSCECMHSVAQSGVIRVILN